MPTWAGFGRPFLVMGDENGRAGDSDLVGHGERHSRRGDAAVRWVSRYAQRVAVRTVVRWVVLAGIGLAAAWLSVGDARAQVGNCPSLNECSREEAYQACMVHAPTMANHGTSSNPFVSAWCEHQNASSPNQGRYACRYRLRNTGDSFHQCSSQQFFYYRTAECPAGTEWDDNTQSCRDPNECLNRNREEGFFNVGQVLKPFREKCVAGCMYSSADAQCSTDAGTGFSSCAGTYEWGGMCSTTPPAPGEPAVPSLEEIKQSNQNEEECAPAAGGQSFCVRRDGRECYKVQRTGGEFCWRPGETGDKASGDTLQKRDAGTQPIPPANPNLPTGDTLQPDGGATTVTTQRPAAGGGTTVITTTTQNYKTDQGTDAKPGSPDQSVGGEDGDDDKDQEGSAEGGEDCESRPIVKGDAILGMIADQAWHTRCAVEAGNAAKATGDVADCKSPFTVEGTNANALQLRALRKSICGDEEAREEAAQDNADAAGAANGEIAGYEAQLNEAAERGIFGNGAPGGGEPGQGIDPNWLSFGGGACPALSIEFPTGTWVPPAAFCNAIAALAVLFQVVATIWALRIVAE